MEAFAEAVLHYFLFYVTFWGFVPTFPRMRSFTTWSLCFLWAFCLLSSFSDFELGAISHWTVVPRCSQDGRDWSTGRTRLPSLAGGCIHQTKTKVGHTRGDILQEATTKDPSRSVISVSLPAWDLKCRISQTRQGVSSDTTLSLKWRTTNSQTQLKKWPQRKKVVIWMFLF